MDKQQKNDAPPPPWLSVPQFGNWDQKGGVQDYSMDFSKIREMRKQNKRELSRASIGNEDEFRSSDAAAKDKKPTESVDDTINPSHKETSSVALMMPKSSSCKTLGRDGERGMKVTCQAASIPADRVPDMEKRKLMNLLLLGALSLPTAGMLVPYAVFFAPQGVVAEEEATSQRMRLAIKVIAAEWLKTHGPGDPTYLVVESDKTLATYGINWIQSQT